MNNYIDSKSVCCILCLLWKAKGQRRVPNRRVGTHKPQKYDSLLKKQSYNNHQMWQRLTMMYTTNLKVCMSPLLNNVYVCIYRTMNKAA